MQTRTHAQKYFKKVIKLCEKHDAEVPADLLSTKAGGAWKYGEHDLRKLPIAADPTVGRKKYTCPIRATQPMSPARFEATDTPPVPTLFEALKTKPRRMRSSSFSSLSSEDGCAGSPGLPPHIRRTSGTGAQSSPRLKPRKESTEQEKRVEAAIEATGELKGDTSEFKSLDILGSLTVEAAQGADNTKQ